MTQDEIIEMARKIATEASKAGPYCTWTHEYAMSLIMQLVDASAAKEREACAKVADEMTMPDWVNEQIATAIRARAQAERGEA